MNSIACFVLILVVGQAWSDPVGYHDPESRLAVVSELSQRLASHSPLLQESRQESRLPLPGLPSPQELEAIKKVAQILIMLGEQVIPTIIGDSPPLHGSNCDTVAAVEEIQKLDSLREIPNNPVNEN